MVRSPKKWFGPHEFTVQQYHRLIDHGIVDEGDRVELIRERIVEKPTITGPHMYCVIRLTRQLVFLVDHRAVVSVQNPIVLSDSEPEPDLALVAPEVEQLRRKPEAALVLLVVEVADGSLERDRTVKLPLYAEAGIGDFWIVNLEDRVLEVYRNPQADGTYFQVQTFHRGDTVPLLALPDLAVVVSDIL